MSTIAEIGFWPTEINLFFSHLGLSVFLTLVIKQLPKTLHPWPFSLVIFTFSLISLKTTKTDRFLFLSNTLLSQIFIVVGIYFFINLTYQEANLTLVFGYILSASISLVFIGSPAGIGIREYIAVLLFSNNFDQNFVLELIISLRILTVFMDLFSYLGYFIYKKINSL